MELRQFLVNRYPELDAASVEGANYPAPEPVGTIAQVLGSLQLLAMPFLFLGDSLLGAATHPALLWIRENKMTVFFSIYMANIVAQNAAQTGAFEIIHNGKTVYSKLDTQRMPTIAQIVDGLKRSGLHMQS